MRKSPEHSPRHPQPWDILSLIFLEWRALFSFHRKHYTQAREHAERALQIDSYNHRLFWLIGTSYLQTQEPIQAIRHLETALQCAPQDKKIIATLGQAHAQAGNPYTALRHFKRIQNHAGLLSLVPLFLKQRDLHCAMLCALEVPKEQAVEALENVGQAHMEMGHLEDALTCFGSIPHTPKLILLAQRFFSTGRYALAIRCFAKTSLSTQERSQRLCDMGQVLRRQGDLEHAALFYDQAQEHSILHSIGKDLLLQGKNDLALSAFLKANALVKDSRYLNDIEKTYR